MKKIKSIATTKFEIELFEEKHHYLVVYTKQGHKPVKSERLTDLKNASYLFDLKLISLEGN